MSSQPAQAAASLLPRKQWNSEKQIFRVYDLAIVQTQGTVCRNWNIGRADGCFFFFSFFFFGLILKYYSGRLY